ncbi:MAG: translation elongation factor Ts [Spirochaetia bacterium]|nr:translation elongation factor Ts [Spirochaetia bacterium]
MTIKASDVKKLREKTGAGMLDCKKALVETDGNFQQAEKKLKELGLAAAAKRSGRATNNGRISTKITSDRAGILEIACETDFVARNKDFIALGDALLSTVFEKNKTEIDEELENMVKDLISTIKENMTLKRFSVLPLAENEIAADYIHGEGALGVLVKMKADNTAVLANEAVKEFLFNCALHIAAFSPLYLSKELVDAEYLEEQKDIFTKQVAAMDKPANVVENIVKGKINKHFSEICFLQQPFVKDDKSSVSQVLAALSKEVGTKLEITDYRYFKVGEEA